jgi:hypothetical protein
MDKNAVDERIAASIARRAGASSSEQFPVTIEQGTEKVRNRVAPNQIESTVRCSEWKEPEKPTGYKPADIKNVDPVEPRPDEIITVGRVTFAPSPITGWEARLTRGWTAYDITLDGEVVKGDKALEALYLALREQQVAPKGKAK